MRQQLGPIGHERERLVLAVLAAAQQRDGLLVRRVAGEVIAAQALDREDLAVAEEADRRLEAHRQLGAAGRAGDRLGVEAPVAWVLVLPPAVGAHREARHGRVRPVVRNPLDDREAWPALGAVDERVPVAAVGRIEELAQALVAGGDIGRDQCRAGCGGALGDREGGLAPTRDDGLGHLLDMRQRRSLALEREAEVVKGARVALRLDDDTRPVVQHEAAEPVAAGEAVDERTEADALDYSRHSVSPTLHAA